jgi:hypothetical protein
MPCRRRHPAASGFSDETGAAPPRRRRTVLDTDDAQLFEAQTEAISALARLLATDCADWRSFLAEGRQ